MDGQALDLPDESFDAVILHLILAVIPDPVACLQEAARVLKPGGRIAVFDKFLPDGARPTLPRRIANAVGRTLFTDINRRMGDILSRSGASLRVEHDEPALMGGMFWVMVLRKAWITSHSALPQKCRISLRRSTHSALSPSMESSSGDAR
jgi:phosphatidylethanolamine/phosphatidyl-N-methylethanolamine N-methyltransferase